LGRTESLESRAHWLAELRAALTSLTTALFDWRPWALMIGCVALLLVCTQVPQQYTFEIGRIVGTGSDLPFMRGFHPHERSAEGVGYRWSKAEEASIELPGLGRRGVIVYFDVISHRAQWDLGEPTLLTLRSGDLEAFTFPLRLEGSSYQVYLPPEALPDGVLRLEVRTPVWQKEGDSRDELGVAIGGHVRVRTVASGGFVWPDRALLFGLPIAVGLLWCSLIVLRFPRRDALLMLLPVAIVAPLLVLYDAPRLGFGSTWMVQFGLISVASALVSVWLIPSVLDRLGAPASSSVLRWLGLLVAMSFALKYGGRLYPDAMPGDLQLHVNRYTGTITGQVYIPAQHRGLPFPFPTGPYLLLAPFTLLGIDIRTLLPISAGLFEATTVLLLYVLGVRVLRSQKIGLLMGAIYAVTSAGFMTSWFAFETQIVAQWFSIVLFVLLAVTWPRFDWRVWAATLLLLSQVFLGHIGLFINVGILGVLAVPLLWWRARSDAERRAALRLLTVGVVASLFAFLFFYSAFMGMIIEQVTGVAQSGLVEVTGRAPIPRETTLWVTWEGGLITHYGFFPVLLMVPGLVLLWVGRDSVPVAQRTLLSILLVLTLLVSAWQAVLPLFTLSSITTRWLMFSGWAIVLGGAVGALKLWRRGWAARVVSVGMSLYVGWLTLTLFLTAMALRKPPIEPF
jgi:hypothetical protein